MPVSNLSLRDRQRLEGSHPDLIQKVDTLFGLMAADGHPMFVVGGLRTVAQQQADYAKGRTVPGPHVKPGKPMGDVVTNCDGIVHKSNHQARADGYGHAVDCAFQGADPFGEHIRQPWQVYGEKAEGLGLGWGGRFHIVDNDHIELK